MEFCEVCDNMMFLELRTDNQPETPQALFHACKKCGNEKKVTESVVSSVTFKKQEQHESVVNKYTKLDPTLPRIYTLKCPKEGCENHTAESPEIIYIRYDNSDLKYAYLCPICDTVWKTEKN